MKSSVAAVLLLAFAALAIFAITGESITGDEVAHLPAGYSYLATGDYRMNPQHPPLVKALAALPLYFLDLQPVTDSAAWSRRQEWAFGKEFLTQNRVPLRTIVFLARLPMVALGLLLGLFLYLWATELWGRGPALFVLLLYCFCPNFLAHTGYVTTDVGVSCFTVASLYCLWRYVHEASWRWLGATGFALGCALLAKYTGVVTAFLVAALLGASLLCRVAESRERAARELRQTLLAGMAIAAIAAAVVSVGFGFPHGIANYLQGFNRIYADSNRHWEGFLWGEYSAEGFRDYYVLAQLWKTPLPALIAFAGALFCVDVSMPRRALEWTFMLLPLVTFHVAGVFNHANIGIRHVLPAFPFLFLAGGATARWLASRPLPAPLLLGVLAVWQIAGTMRVAPYFLPYFNELAGGPAHGSDYLDDSNVEWGQDLDRLKAYLDAHPSAKVRILAFEPLARSVYGLPPESVHLNDLAWPEEGVTYCVGAGYLRRSSLFNDYPGVRFPWPQRYRPVDRVGYGINVYRFSTRAGDAGRHDLIYVPREKWYTDAIETLRTIIAANPAFIYPRDVLADVYADRARWKESQGDREGGTLDLLEALRSRPERVTYRTPFREAATRLEREIAVDAEIPDIDYQEGLAALRARSEGPALLAFLRVLRKDDRHLAARSNLGVVYETLGLSGMARVEWQRCLRIDPRYQPAAANLATLEKRAKTSPDRAS